MRVAIVPSIIPVGFGQFVLSLVGSFAGDRVGRQYGSEIDVVGGSAFVGIGVTVLPGAPSVGGVGMKQVAVLMGLLALVVVMSGCGGDKDEQATREMIDCMRDMNSVLEGVKDKASAEAAKPKMEKIAKRMEALGKRAKEMGDPPKEREDELKKKYDKEMKEVMGNMMNNMQRLATIEGGAELGKLFENIKMPD